MAKNSFLLYYNQNEIFNELTDEEAGKLIKAVFDYEINGSVSKDKFTRALMIPIKQVLDKNKEEYEIICERNKKNIQKRWDTKNTTGTTGIPVDTTQYESVPKILDMDMDMDMDMEMDMEMDIDMDIDMDNINNNIYSREELDSIPYNEIVNYLNFATGYNYKHTTRKTQTLIKARFKEGFNLDDFKTVIDNMTREWLNDEKMKPYLRPETLFGTKFESYLNRPKKQLTTKDLEKYINVEEAFL